MTEPNDGCAVAVLCVIGIMFGLFLGGRYIGVSSIRGEAIEHNCAEWRIDPTTGERTFTWKEPK